MGRMTPVATGITALKIDYDSYTRTIVYRKFRNIEYTQLTGLLKNKALNELNGWVKEGVLDTIGSGSHKIYVRANTKKE